MNKISFIYALGFFDGVHLGHQALLGECVRLARTCGAVPAAVTFDAHPQSLFASTVPGLINSLPDRTALLKRYGMEAVKVLPVTAQTMGQPWEAFLEDLMAQGAVGFVCGQDFRFGHRGAGTAWHLQRFCQERHLPCVILQDQTLEGIRISSTHIRGLLEKGDIEAAVDFLGHGHVLTGTVVPGRHIGRTMGTPTANLTVPQGVTLPEKGVYACKALVEGQEYLAATNIGNRPTVGGRHTTVEPWLLDFTGDLYGRELTLVFYRYLRPERKFGSLEDLQAEIQKNAAQTRKIFENS